MYIRSLTVYLVRQGTLDDYVYLEHGAHYAIGALAVILLVTIKYEINEVITGLVGVVLIGASFWSSVRAQPALGEGPRAADDRTRRRRSRPGCDRRRLRNALERGGRARSGRPAAVDSRRPWDGRAERWGRGHGLLGRPVAADARPSSTSAQRGHNAIELTKRHPTVSLTKQGAAIGNLRINLSWQMRTSDIGGGAQRGSLLRHPLQAVQAARWCRRTGPRMVNVDLDLACMYELADGTKGVVQPLGDFLGDLNAPPYVKLSGDDRFGVGVRRDDLRQPRPPGRDQAAAGLRLHLRRHARLRPHARHGRRSSRATARGSRSRSTSGHPQARSCAVVLIENVKGELIVRREVKYVYGFQAELDRLYGWGLQWGRGYKSKVEPLSRPPARRRPSARRAGTAAPAAAAEVRVRPLRPAAGAVRPARCG